MPGKSDVGVRPPNQSAIIACVLRTGFATEQGNLMRAILGTMAPPGSGDRDAFRFIAAMGIFAAVSTSFS